MGSTMPVRVLTTCGVHTAATRTGAGHSAPRSGSLHVRPRKQHPEEALAGWGHGILGSPTQA